MEVSLVQNFSNSSLVSFAFKNWTVVEEENTKTNQNHQQKTFLRIQHHFWGVSLKMKLYSEGENSDSILTCADQKSRGKIVYLYAVLKKSYLLQLDLMWGFRK